MDIGYVEINVSEFQKINVYQSILQFDRKCEHPSRSAIKIFAWTKFKAKKKFSFLRGF